MRLNEAPSERQSGEMPTDCVGWGRMATCADSYESEGRLFESAWAHSAFACFLSAAQCLALFRLEPVRTDDDRSTRIGHRATRREGMTPQHALLAACAPARSRISSCADRRAQRQAYGPGGVGRSFAGSVGSAGNGTCGSRW